MEFSHEQGCGVLILLLMVASVLLLSMWKTAGRDRIRVGVFTTVGRRRNGQAMPGGWFANPRLEFLADNIPGEVTFNDSSRGRRWTKVQLNWPTAQRLRVTPQGFTHWLRSLFEGDGIEVGDPDFDTHFWVEASDPDWARRILSEKVRRRFLGLRQDATLLRSNDVTLDVGPSGLTIRVSKLLVDDSDNLEWFLDMAMLVLAEVRAHATVAGVTIAGMEIQSSSACPVCGHEVESARTCSQCGTPHHEDCWKYSGGCAIFACAGRARR